MNIERLKQLRRVIEEAPEDRLHMNNWSGIAECGTVYCAIGWAAIDPWFRKNTGIWRIFEKSMDGILHPLTCSTHETACKIAKMFDISPKDTMTLFAIAAGTCFDDHDITKREVLANIDRIIAGKPARPYKAVVS